MDDENTMIDVLSKGQLKLMLILIFMPILILVVQSVTIFLWMNYGYITTILFIVLVVGSMAAYYKSKLKVYSESNFY